MLDQGERAENEDGGRETRMDMIVGEHALIVVASYSPSGLALSDAENAPYKLTKSEYSKRYVLQVE